MTKRLWIVCGSTKICRGGRRDGNLRAASRCGLLFPLWIYITVDEIDNLRYQTFWRLLFGMKSSVRCGTTFRHTWHLRGRSSHSGWRASGFIKAEEAYNPGFWAAPGGWDYPWRK